MTRQLLVLIVSTLILVPYAPKAEEPTPKKAAQPRLNQVYVKVIMPADPADRDKDRPVVESWIAEALKKRGQVRFTAVTGWWPKTFDFTMRPNRRSGASDCYRSSGSAWFDSIIYSGIASGRM